MDFNRIIARAKAILLTPKTEWPVIASEPATVADLYKNYIVIMAAIPAIAGFLKMSVIGISVPFAGTIRVGIASGITSMVVGYLLALGMIYVMALIVDALAPSFDGQKNIVQALKTVTYAYTASWVAGIFQILPLLAFLITIAGAVYSIYLVYLGLPQTMKCPPEKSAGYTAVTIIVGIVLSIVVGMVVAGVTGVSGMMAPSGSMTTSSNNDVQFDKNSPLGKMQEWSKSVESASKNMEAAEKSGNKDAQAAAFKTMMGAALGGGGSVEALAPDRLKPFIPESLAGMPRTEISAERNGAMGMQISEARATYANEAGKSVKLEITDAGSAKGLLGMASWAGVEGEKQTDSGYEKTYRNDGNLVHEEWHGTRGEYTVVVADRFTVQVEGYADNIDQLKAAVSDLDLSGLADLKDEGVKKE